MNTLPIYCISSYADIMCGQNCGTDESEYGA